MKNFQISEINDNIVNRYLIYKNLEINRKYSSNKKKIKQIDHYLWWFKEQNSRKSFLILKDKNPIFISTCDFFKIKNRNCIYSGLLSCLPNTNLFDLLKAIKIQNNYLNKQKIIIALYQLIRKIRFYYIIGNILGIISFLKRIFFTIKLKNYLI